MPTIACLALALHIVPQLSAVGASRTDVDDHILQRDTRIPDLWVSDLFYRALANFTLRRAAGTECRRQTAVYERDLRNHTSWAVRMQESWNRYPVGLLTGNTYQMGDYDECVDL
ncbi:nose resistant to fluoxetine protein 6-like isoform X1, partial [Aphis craccivora]